MFEQPISAHEQPVYATEHLSIHEASMFKVCLQVIFRLSLVASPRLDTQAVLLQHCERENGEEMKKNSDPQINARNCSFTTTGSVEETGSGLRGRRLFSKQQTNRA